MPNLKQVHTIVRMMRLTGQILCPSVLLLGEVVMEPEKVVPYFGTLEKFECHMLCNVTTMATTWHTVATHDTPSCGSSWTRSSPCPRSMCS